MRRTSPIARNRPERNTSLDNVNKWALGWSVLWVVLGTALIVQLVTLSIPDRDMLLIGIDITAVAFVIVRLRRSVAVLIKDFVESPGPKD